MLDLPQTPKLLQLPKMTIDNLRRVMWRLRSNNPGRSTVLNNELKRAIMHEIGTDYRTHKNNRKALVTLGWIKSEGNKRITLTDKDLTE